MDLTDFIPFLIPKIVCHLVFMQFPLFVNNFWNKENQETYPEWLFLYF